MEVLNTGGEQAVLHINAGERDMLLAILDAAKATDPVITDADPDQIDFYIDLVSAADASPDGFALTLSKRQFLNIRRFVTSVTIMGEREEYSDYINRIQADETIDLFDEAIDAAYRAAFPG